MKRKTLTLFALISFVSIGLSACNGTDGGTGNIQGQDQTPHPANPIPTGSPPISGGGNTSTSSPPPSAITPTCHSSTDANHICLALKYVVYKDSAGSPVISEAQAISNTATISNLWSQCDIGFQIDNFVAADPAPSGLTFNTANVSELDSVRSVFEDSTTLLVVTTGTWNRSGTLGNTGANAWTNMPGDGIYGSILEAPVGNYPNIIAHELGHYLNLNHVADTSNLMNPIIYDTSATITQSQCTTARAAAAYYWSAMSR